MTNKPVTNKIVHPARHWSCVASLLAVIAGGCADPEAGSVPFLPPISHCAAHMVYFDSGSARLSDFFRESLTKQVSFSPKYCGIDSNPANRSWVVVEGHADKSGLDAANEQLSLQRAQTVARRLIELGVAREYICLSAKGSRALMVPQAQGAEPQDRYVVIYRVSRDRNPEACPVGSVPFEAG